MTGKCSVCGRIGRVYVCSSLCGAMSNAYCEDCLDSGAEPWGDLVAYIALAGRYPDDINEWYREVVRNTCRRLGHTEEEFAAAVVKCAEEMDREYDEYVKNRSKAGGEVQVQAAPW